jgi:hypothetical protein
MYTMLIKRKRVSYSYLRALGGMGFTYLNLISHVVPVYMRERSNKKRELD